MNMLEKAARAACEDAGFDPDEMMANGGPRWRYYAPTARAVLAAIREPDEGMVHAGGEACQEHCAMTMLAARGAWTAMLDAILEGESK